MANNQARKSDRQPCPAPWSRRQMLKSLSCGFGYLALKSLLADSAAQAASPGSYTLAPKKPPLPAKAKHVIFLFMHGAPSHVDLLDYKPRLTKDSGNADPKGSGRKLMGSPWKFKQHGKAGHWISELLPNIATQADHLCVLNGMRTESPNHPQATLMLHTGSTRFARPSLGAWTLYGLGAENRNLPGFIAINPVSVDGGAQNYGNAFMPGIYQGTTLGGGEQDLGKAKFQYISNPRLDAAQQQRQLKLLTELHHAQFGDGQETPFENLISDYELAFRMQTAAPQLLSFADESPRTLERYGINNRVTADFGRQCLLARRCVEAGVRFVELTSPDWDHHSAMRARLSERCKSVDQPIAALLADLNERGLLDETLVIWGGEFGRTPTAQASDGRDHNSSGFSMWLAGGGVKPGFRYGSTDDYGIAAVEGRMDTHDLHATILRLLGFDHKQLTYRYSGRDFRLTDVFGNVATDIIA